MNCLVIHNIREIADFKSRGYIVMTLQILLTVVLLVTAYISCEGIVENVALQDTMLLMIFSGVLIIIVCAMFITWCAMIKFLPRASICRSYWLINAKGVYVEQNDELDVEFRLKTIALDLTRFDLSEDSFSAYNTYKNMSRKEFVLRISIFIIMLLLIFLGIREFIPKEIFAMIIPIFIVAAVGVKMYDIKRDYKKLRWKE